MTALAELLTELLIGIFQSIVEGALQEFLSGSVRFIFRKIRIFFNISGR